MKNNWLILLFVLFGIEIIALIYETATEGFSWIYVAVIISILTLGGLVASNEKR